MQVKGAILASYLVGWLKGRTVTESLIGCIDNCLAGYRGTTV